MSGETQGWRRLSPSAELLIDPESGARCAIRDSRRSGTERYLWTLTVFGYHQLAEGRTGELAEARSRAEAALAGYAALRSDGGGCPDDWAGMSMPPGPGAGIRYSPDSRIASRFCCSSYSMLPTANTGSGGYDFFGCSDAAFSLAQK